MTSPRTSRHAMCTNRSTRRLRLGTLLLFSLTAACSKAAAPKGRPPVPVVVTRARLMDVPYTIEANGVVIPLRAATVGSQVEGIIKRVAFTEGQNVTAGQVLFEVDPRLYRGAYQLQGVTIKKRVSDLMPLLTVKNIDLSLAWRALLRKELNGDLRISGLVLHLAQSANEKKQQLGIDEDKLKNLKIF